MICFLACLVYLSSLLYPRRSLLRDILSSCLLSTFHFSVFRILPLDRKKHRSIHYQQCFLVYMAMFKLQTLLIPEALPVQAPMMTTRPMIRISRTVAIALSFTVKSLFLIVSTINSSCDPLTSGHIVNCPSFHNLCDFFSQVYTSSFAIYAASLGRLRVLEHIALHCIAGPVCKARQDRQTDRHN